MARVPWISLALFAVAASLTTRIDAVFAAGEALAPAAAKAATTSPLAIETRVGAALASDLQQQSRTAERVRALDLRSAMLAATEKRIDSKLEQIGSRGARLLAPAVRPARRVIGRAPDYTAPTSPDARIAALVKMYQAMRPKDAARILERVDIDLQVEVAGHMRERAAAAILAEMDPKAASDLTAALAGYSTGSGSAGAL